MTPALTDIDVRLVTAAEREQVYVLRNAVFVTELGVPAEVDRDGKDDHALHAVALSGGEVVATGRLVVAGDGGEIARIAVLQSWRRQGVGTRILRQLENVAHGRGLSTVELHAPVKAQDFYVGAGYEIVGDAFGGPEFERVLLRKPLPVRREVRDSDSAGLIDLIGGCFAEYPGCVLDVDAEEPWLRAPAAAFTELGGRMWVEALGGPDGPIVASIALKPSGPGVVELKSLYVSASARRSGLGRSLVTLVEDDARGRGATAIHLWTDTRFVDAHRLYERHGYVRQPETRALNDLSETVEYHYYKDIES